MQPPSVIIQNKYHLFLLGLALLLIALGGVVTSRYGAGITSDAANKARALYCRDVREYRPEAS